MALLKYYKIRFFSYNFTYLTCTEHIGLYILASNISMWLAKSIPPQKSDGMLIEIDHWNQMTNVKETTLKYCDRNPEDKGANCTTVGYKVNI